MNPHPFRILVIEDNPNWHEPMRLALESNQGKAIEAVMASDARKARDALARWRFHLVSHDLHISALPGDSLKTEVGTDLLEEAGALLLPQFVLSGYLGGPGGLSAARVSGRLDAQLFSKAPGEGLDHREAPPLTAQGWAELVAFALGLAEEETLPESVRETYRDRPTTPLQYRPEYWRRAGQALPDPLARAAQSIHADWERKQESTLQAAYRFGEWTLRLAWAQTAVLLRELGRPVRSGLADDKVSEKERELLAWLDKKAGPELLCAPGWRAHLGLMGRGVDDLAEALRTLRLKRNQMAHSLRDLPAAEDFWQSLDGPILAVMDMAAYWAQFPLFGRAIQRTGGWEATAIRGTARMGPSIRLPLETFSRAPDERHVFQRLPLEIDGRIEWRTVDWYPWLQFLPDRDYAAYRAWLLSHRTRDGRWVQVCLSHDETREVLIDDRMFG